MKKILASLLAITMLLTTMSACVIPASAETVASNAESQPEYIFKEDFSAYATDGTNWLTTVGTNNFVTVDGVESGKFTARKGAAGVNTHSAKVVIDPLDTTGENKVMALDAYDTTVGESDGKYGYASQLRINADANNGIARSAMGKGKKLVYKAKIYMPANFVMYESTFLVNQLNRDLAQVNAPSGHTAKNAGSFIYPIRTGTTGYPATPSITYDIRGGWTEIKHVVDVSKELSATHSDTARAYLGGRLLISNLRSGASAHGVNAKYQLTEGTTIIDNLPARALFQNGAEYESMGNMYWGSHFTISTASNTPKDGNSKYYIDDLEAYWIDALKFDAINAADYQGGNIKLVFNQKLMRTVLTREEYLNKSYTYDKLFSLVDENGNTVSGTTVELSADDKTVTIKPGSLVKGADYKIVIDPKLIDEHGQGLENNSKATYIDVHVSENMVDFGATLSKNAITNFKQGRETKVTATFTHEIENSAITNGIDVKDAEGNEYARDAENSWTAEISAGNKEVIFDFTNLPTENYTVTANENLVSASGLPFTGSFNITIQGAAKPIELFNETFESNSGFTYPTGNWFDQPKDNSLNNFAYGGRRRVGNWDVQRADNNVNGDTEDSSISFIGVVDAPAGVEGGLDGKVLKIHSAENSGTTSNNTISFRRNFTTDCKPLKLEGEYAGKQLVYEADIYAENMGSNTQFFLPSLTKSTINVTSDGVWNNYFSGGQYYANGGHYGTSFATYGPVSAWAWASSPAKDSIMTAPRKLKVVIDQSTELDTMRIYLNGNLVKRAAGDVARLKDHEMNNEDRFDLGPGYGFTNGDKYGRKFDMNTVGDAQGMYGIWSAVVGTSSSPTTIYIDNFKAYLVDPFEVESVTGASEVFNVAKGAVTFTFTKPVNVDTATANANIVLLGQDGKEVSGGIESVTSLDGGYKLEVKLSDTLPTSETFTIKLKKELTDEDGYSIKTQYHYYDYPINIYPLKEGTTNVYLVSDPANTKTWECTYTAKTADAPAYLTYNGSYKAAVDAYLPDYYKMKTAVDVTISAYTSVFAEATSATISGNAVTTKVTFTNPESDAMNVWAVVAAYGEYNQMLGCSQVAVTNGEIPVGVTGPVDVTINVEDGSKVKAVKLFVWDTYTNMKPYHKAAELEF